MRDYEEYGTMGKVGCQVRLMEYGTMGKVGCQVRLRCNNSHLNVWNSANNMGEGK